MQPLSDSTVEILTQLKEDMNRMYQRPYVLMVYLYNIFQGLNFGEFSQSENSKIYQDQPRGVYPKVLGMVLQQAFSQYECIPVDTWVKTFFKILLGVEESNIPESGRNLGKFERFVWNVAQLRKTNQPLFDDIVHCIKTGIMHSSNMKMRKPNPLSCYLCELSQEGCPVYQDIREKKVAIIDRDSCTSESDGNQINLHMPAKKVNDYIPDLYPKENYFEFSDVRNIDFIVLSSDGEAIASYIPARKDKTKWKRTDEMSPFTTYISLEEGILEVGDIVGS